MLAERDIRGVIFDKDGTLLAFELSWIAYCEVMLDHLAGEDATQRLRLAQTCGYDLHNRCFRPGSLIVGGSIEEVCQSWARLAEHHDLDEIRRLSRTCIAALPSEPIGDLATLLGGLAALRLKLGVVTNDLEDAARMQLCALGLDGYFQMIIGSDSGYASKPSPEALLAFCAAQNILPEQLAMVGDSPHDLRAARACGALAIGVMSGPATRETLAPWADLILPDTSHLPVLLEA